MEVTVTQKIEDFLDRYRGSACIISRNYEHRCMSNNWLRMHKMPMRRKPFKRRFPILDEFTGVSPNPTSIVTLEKYNPKKENKLQVGNSLSSRKQLTKMLDAAGIKYIVVDSAGEYPRTAIELGGEVIQLSNAGDSSINLFEETTKYFELEDDKLLEEKEAEIRQLLDCIGFSPEFIKEILADMSFLDKDPAWKERVISILQEYEKK